MTIEEVNAIKAATARLLHPLMRPGQIYMGGEIHFPSAEEIEMAAQTYIVAGVTAAEIHRLADERDAAFKAAP